MHKFNDFLSRFSFNTTPFTREFHIEKRFVLDVFDTPLQYLCRAVDNRLSALLVAPAGTGKTVILRAMQEKLPKARYKMHYIKLTSLCTRDLCREIATSVNTQPTLELSTLVRRLQQRFETNYENNGIRSVLVLDDAHLMRPETLSILNTLTNFEMDSRLVLSVILVGQPSLNKLLEREQMQDTRYRMAHCAQLRLLSRSELSQYIQHRCHIVANTSNPFTQSAIEAIYELTRGNLRATDYLALKSLEVAHDEKVDTVDTNQIMTARSLLWA